MEPREPMKPICQLCATLCLLLLLAAPARGEHAGPYLGVYAGAHSLQSSRAVDDLGSFGLKFEPALQGSVVCGWDFEPGNPLGEGRVELEYSRRRNPLKEVNFVEGGFSGGGSVTADSLLVNFFGVYHDRSRWSPYIGAGIGAAIIKATDLQVTGQPLSSDAAVTLAYQVGAGLEYRLTERLSLDIGYRFFGSSRPRFTESNGHDFEMGYTSHSAVLGLKLGF